MKYWKRELKNFVLIILAVFSAGMGIHGFLLSSRFIDGGVTGISMLVSNVIGWPLPVLIAVINLPFVAVGYLNFGCTLDIFPEPRLIFDRARVFFSTML